MEETLTHCLINLKDDLEELQRIREYLDSNTHSQSTQSCIITWRTIEALNSILEICASQDNPDTKALDTVLDSFYYVAINNTDKSVWSDFGFELGTICMKILSAIEQTPLFEDLFCKLLTIINAICEYNSYVWKSVARQILNVFINKKFSFSYFEAVLKWYISVLRNVESSVLYNFAQQNSHLLKTLSMVVQRTGDFQTQMDIMEIVFLHVVNDRNLIENYFMDDKNSKLFKTLSFTDFEEDSRIFLNDLNKSLGVDRKVYSINCHKVYLGNCSLEPPFENKCIWMDANKDSERLSIKCADFQPDQESSISQCVIHLYFQDIEGVKLEYGTMMDMRCYCVTLNMRNLDKMYTAVQNNEVVCIILEDENSKEVVLDFINFLEDMIKNEDIKKRNSEERMSQTYDKIFTDKNESLKEIHSPLQNTPQNAISHLSDDLRSGINRIIPDVMFLFDKMQNTSNLNLKIKNEECKKNEHKSLPRYVTTAELLINTQTTRTSLSQHKMTLRSNKNSQSFKSACEKVSQKPQTILPRDTSKINVIRENQDKKNKQIEEKNSSQKVSSGEPPVHIQTPETILSQHKMTPRSNKNQSENLPRVIQASQTTISSPKEDQNKINIILESQELTPSSFVESLNKNLGINSQEIKNILEEQLEIAAFSQKSTDKKNHKLFRDSEKFFEFLDGDDMGKKSLMPCDLENKENIPPKKQIKSFPIRTKKLRKTKQKPPPSTRILRSQNNLQDRDDSQSQSCFRAPVANSKKNKKPSLPRLKRSYSKENKTVTEISVKQDAKPKKNSNRSLKRLDKRKELDMCTYRRSIHQGVELKTITSTTLKPSLLDPNGYAYQRWKMPTTSEKSKFWLKKLEAIKTKDSNPESVFDFSEDSEENFKKERTSKRRKAVRVSKKKNYAPKPAFTKKEPPMKEVKNILKSFNKSKSHGLLSEKLGSTRLKQNGFKLDKAKNIEKDQQKFLRESGSSKTQTVLSKTVTKKNLEASKANKISVQDDVFKETKNYSAKENKNLKPNTSNDILLKEKNDTNTIRKLTENTKNINENENINFEDSVNNFGEIKNFNTMKKNEILPNKLQQGASANGRHNAIRKVRGNPYHSPTPQLSTNLVTSKTKDSLKYQQTVEEFVDLEFNTVENICDEYVKVNLTEVSRNKTNEENGLMEKNNKSIKDNRKKIATRNECEGSVRPHLNKMEKYNKNKQDGVLKQKINENKRKTLEKTTSNGREEEITGKLPEVGRYNRKDERSILREISNMSNIMQNSCIKKEEEERVDYMTTANTTRNSVENIIRNTPMRNKIGINISAQAQAKKISNTTEKISNGSIRNDFFREVETKNSTRESSEENFGTNGKEEKKNRNSANKQFNENLNKNLMKSSNFCNILRGREDGAKEFSNQGKESSSTKRAGSKNETKQRPTRNINLKEKESVRKLNPISKQTKENDKNSSYLYNILWNEKEESPKDASDKNKKLFSMSTAHSKGGIKPENVRMKSKNQNRNKQANKDEFIQTNEHENNKSLSLNENYIDDYAKKLSTPLKTTKYDDYLVEELEKLYSNTSGEFGNDYGFEYGNILRWRDTPDEPNAMDDEISVISAGGHDGMYANIPEENITKEKNLGSVNLTAGYNSEGSSGYTDHPKRNNSEDKNTEDLSLSKGKSKYKNLGDINLSDGGNISEDINVEDISLLEDYDLEEDKSFLNLNLLEDYDSGEKTDKSKEFKNYLDSLSEEDVCFETKKRERSEETSSGKIRVRKKTRRQKQSNKKPFSQIILEKFENKLQRQTDEIIGVVDEAIDQLFNNLQRKDIEEFKSYLKTVEEACSSLEESNDLDIRTRRIKRATAYYKAGCSISEYCGTTESHFSRIRQQLKELTKKDDKIKKIDQFSEGLKRLIQCDIEKTVRNEFLSNRKRFLQCMSAFRVNSDQSD